MDYNKLTQALLNIMAHFKQSLLEFLPNLAGAIFILVVGFLIARLARALIIRFTNKLHRLIPNQRISNKVRGFIEEKPVTRVIGGILYWILVFFFLTVATETLGLPVVTTWFSGIVSYLPKILTATLISIAGVIAGVILRELTTTGALSAGIVYGTLLGKIIQVIVIVITILIAIDQIGIDVSLLENVTIITFGALLLSIRNGRIVKFNCSERLKKKI
jgi:hypothetical protein